MSARPDRGFSLIEVIIATGAFVTVFLAGTSGFMRMWMRQEMVQQGTLAAAAAITVADWHATQVLAAPAARPAFADSLAGVQGLADDTGRTIVDLPGVDWRGPPPAPGDRIYRFKASATPASGTAIDLGAYARLVMTVSAAASSGGMDFRIVAFWVCSPDDLVAATSATPRRVPAEHAGHVLMPDRLP